MKTTDIIFANRRNKNYLLLIAILIFLTFQLGYAQNRVVVVPLLGDEALAIDPTGPIARDSPGTTDYVINNELTVLDKVTGLEWQRQDDNVLRDWNESLDYCSDLSLGGKTDWHLPDILQLQSILDYGQSASPLISATVFPDTESEDYWSASIGSSESRFAWGASFDIGFIGQRDKSNDYYVRCVRQQK